MTLPPVADRPIVVYKVGGSLLTLPDLRQRLALAINAVEARPLIIAGGGAAADLVRNWDARFALGDESAHWLAIEAMDLTAALLAKLLAGGALVTDRDQAEQVWKSGGTAVLRTREFLRSEEAAIFERMRLDPHATGEPALLPRSWDVTSDSISAWVARLWPADRLVLLKSADASSVPAEASAIVDTAFREWSAGVPSVELINLRAMVLATTTTRLAGIRREDRAR